MIKAEVLALLEAHSPHDQAETDDLNRVLAFVKEHEDFWTRANTTGHVTASAWIINPDRDRALLTHHRKLDRWLQLGGHIEADGNLLAAATREALEESGLATVEAISPHIFDIDVHLIPARKTEPAHYHYDVRFAFNADDADRLVISAESKNLRWIPLDQLPRLVDEPSILRMAEKTERL